MAAFLQARGHAPHFAPGRVDVPGLILADDTAITATSLATAQTRLSLFERWCSAVGLEANPAKFQVLVWNVPGYAASPLTYDGTALPLQHHARYLGLHLDANLSWAPQAEILQRTLSSAHRLLGRKRFSLRAAAYIVSAYAASKVLYPLTAGAGLTDRQVTELDHRLASIIKSCARMPRMLKSEALFAALPFRSLAERARTQRLSFLLEVLNRPLTTASGDADIPARVIRASLRTFESHYGLPSGAWLRPSSHPFHTHHHPPNASARFRHGARGLLHTLRSDVATLRSEVVLSEPPEGLLHARTSWLRPETRAALAPAFVLAPRRRWTQPGLAPNALARLYDDPDAAPPPHDRRTFMLVRRVHDDTGRVHATPVRVAPSGAVLDALGPDRLVPAVDLILLGPTT